MKINVGDFCLLDNENKGGSLDTSDAVIVKIKEKIGFNRFLVEEIDCSDNPTLNPNSYIVGSNHLVPVNKSNHVSIRIPVNMPPISEPDLFAMENIIGAFNKGKPINPNDILRLEMLYTKFAFYKQMFDI